MIKIFVLMGLFLSPTQPPQLSPLGEYTNPARCEEALQENIRKANGKQKPGHKYFFKCVPVNSNFS